MADLPRKTSSLIKPTRRQVLTAGAAGLAASAFPMPFVRAQSAPTEINILAWYGHAEPDIVAEFEELHNVKFVPKYYAGGDNMLALISQSPPGTYDVILSDAEFVQQLNAAGYIEQLDPTDYPFEDMFDVFQKFPGHWIDDELWSVIVRYGHLGVSFNKELVSPEEAMSYNVLWEPKLQGVVGHFDWHLPNLGCISLLMGNDKPSPFDISEDAWLDLQDKMLTLRPQVGGFFDYGGTFASLKSGEIKAMCGIGDWITGVVQKEGVPVDSVVPKEGGIQWTESYCIGKDTEKADIAKTFIQYMLSGPGQVRSAKMAAYPAMLPTKAGWAALQEADMAEAQRQGMVEGLPNNPLTLISEGRIHFRDIPRQQSLEAWNGFWSEYKDA